MLINITYPVIDMERTGEKIKVLRDERNISVSELQSFLGLASPQAIYQWQKGLSLPTVDNLCALSHLFGIPMNDILVLKDKSTTDNSGFSVKRKANSLLHKVKMNTLLMAA